MHARSSGAFSLIKTVGLAEKGIHDFASATFGFSSIFMMAFSLVRYSIIWNSFMCSPASQAYAVSSVMGPARQGGKIVGVSEHDHEIAVCGSLEKDDQIKEHAFWLGYSRRV